MAWLFDFFPHLEHAFVAAVEKQGQLWLIVGISVMSALSQKG